MFRRRKRKGAPAGVKRGRKEMTQASAEEEDGAEGRAEPVASRGEGDREEVENKREDGVKRLDRKEEQDEETTVVRPSRKRRVATAATAGVSAVSDTQASSFSYASQVSSVAAAARNAEVNAAQREVEELRDQDKDLATREQLTSVAPAFYGPKKASGFIRRTMRFDYQPDVCKDYKETGFCGFGDTCKFLHDRSDYKSGWEMEKEWEEAEKKKREEQMMRAMGGGGTSAPTSIAAHGQGTDDSDEGEFDAILRESENAASATAAAAAAAAAAASTSSDRSAEDEQLPFACHICRDHFTNPVVTLCGHYFCSKCAVDRHRANPRCAVCNKETNGVFNHASRLAARIRQQRSKS